MAVQDFPEPLVDERKQALVRTEVRCKPGLQPWIACAERLGLVAEPFDEPSGE